MSDNDIETYNGYSQVKFLWDFIVKKMGKAKTQIQQRTAPDQHINGANV